MNPTAEQQLCIDKFRTGRNLTISAGAGTGKTATLIMLGECDRRRSGQYLAFNKAIVEDAKSKMPPNVRASTMHSLAMSSVGRRFAHRLNAPRMASYELARLLKTRSVTVDVCGDGLNKRYLSDAFLASYIMAAIVNFCRSVDPAPAVNHFEYIEGIDMPTDEGKRTYAHNDALREELLPIMAEAWADLCNPRGVLPFKHDHYLKMWERSNPVIPADFVLLDESQDSDPVMLSIFEQQRSAQLVLVGDENQEIYTWRGAVNAMQKLPFDRAQLSQSFRFGQPIVDVANVFLRELQADLRLVGLKSKPAMVAPIDMSRADAVLCRTNASALTQMIVAQSQGIRTYLMGGTADLLSFVRSAGCLQNGRRATHPELACFMDWFSVQDYVSSDPQGSELALLVKLIDDFGVSQIETALGRQAQSSSVDFDGLTISTVHKAKGRQWGSVHVSNDFKRTDDEGEAKAPTPAELRLMYVAVTRAQEALDCESLNFVLHPEEKRR